MIRITCLSLLALPLLAQSPFRLTRHASLPSIYVGDKFASGDLDGDGDIDLFVANDNAANQLLLNDGDGRFVDATLGRFVTQPGWNATHSVDLADIDGDGDLDVLIGNDDNLSNRVYVNNGLGFFTDVTATALPPNAHFTLNQVVADFDGDGDVDWFTVDNGACHYYENNGAGVFTDQSATQLLGLPPISGDRYATTPRAADIDGDGYLDVMIPRWIGGPYLIQNLGGVLVPSPFQLPLGAVASTCWFADVDGDGDPDVLAGGGSYLLQNQGNGTFVDVTAVAFGATPQNGIACFDVDNDGDVDLVTSAAIWHNNGNGTFVAQSVVTAVIGGSNGGAAAADFDGDGDIDLPGRPNFLRQTFASSSPVHGQSYSVEFHSRPGTFAAVGAGVALAAGTLPAGPFGVLRLDPGTAVALASSLGSTSPLTLSWTLPNVPSLAGIELHFQAVVIDAVEGPVISNAISDVVQ